MEQRDTTLTVRLPEGFSRSRELEGAACGDEIWSERERESGRKGVVYYIRHLAREVRSNLDHQADT